MLKTLQKICLSLGNKLIRFPGVVLTLSILAGGAAQAKSITIGHFGSPTPMQVAAAKKVFSKATGYTIEWRKFPSGTDVIAALASGSIDVAELGSSPLAIAVSSGVDIQLFLFAQGIGQAESLIVRNGSGISKPSDLKGKRIGVPIGSTAHYSLIGALTHWGLSEKDVRLLGMKPNQINAAWSQGYIDAAFIWQPVQSKILKTGKLLVGADDTGKWGYPTFDGWVARSDFIKKDPAFVKSFIKAMNEANALYLNNKKAWQAGSAEIKAIAARTGASAADIPTILKGFTFLTPAEQVSKAWLGSAASSLKNTSEFLKKAGKISATKKDYTPFVNLELATQAMQ